MSLALSLLSSHTTRHPPVHRDYDGSGGNNHGVIHNEQTGHPLVLKVGTITPEGGADIWCYACQKPVIDDKLADHLAAFGIAIAGQKRTSKTLAELALERNLNAQFASVYDKAGNAQTLLFGPGHTGLENLGNSCYMASVVQACFHTPSFFDRYVKQGAEHLATCRSQRPGACYLCQLSKLGTGLWSGRYSQLPTKQQIDEYEQSTTKKKLRTAGGCGVAASDSAMGDSAVAAAAAGSSSAPAPSVVKIGSAVNLQPGVAPRLFKKLIAGPHPLFSGTQQQCAYEYMGHLREQLQRQESALRERGVDVAEDMAFYTNNRIECLQCNHVKYKTTKAYDLALPMPFVAPPSPTAEQAAAEAAKDAAAAEEAARLGKPKPVKRAPEAPPQPAVDFNECLALWAKEDTVEDFSCPVCQSRTIASSRHGFLTFPKVLVVQMRRFGLFDRKSWVPTKLNTDVLFGGEPPPAEIEADDKGVAAAAAADPSAQPAQAKPVKLADFRLNPTRPQIDFGAYLLPGLQDHELAMPEAKGDGAAAGGGGGAAVPDEMVMEIASMTGMRWGVSTTYLGCISLVIDYLTCILTSSLTTQPRYGSPAGQVRAPAVFAGPRPRRRVALQPPGLCHSRRRRGRCCCCGWRRQGRGSCC